MDELRATISWTAGEHL